MRDIDYGTVRIKLNELIEQQGISKNRVVGNWISGSKEEDNYRDETLYCKKNGEYFLDDKGGMCSDYHTAFWIDYDCEHGDWEELIPFSKEEAQEWVMMHMDGDAYEAEFGEVDE